MIDDVFDYWDFNDTLVSSEEIKHLNKIINERYSRLEPLEMGATDNDGNYLKNIKPKIVNFKDIKQEIYHVIDFAYLRCHYHFGFTTYPVNSWDTLLYNEYTSDIKGKYGELRQALENLPNLTTSAKNNVFLNYYSYDKVHLYFWHDTKTFHFPKNFL